MNKKLLGLLLLSHTHVYADSVLPMKNYPLPPGVKTNGYQVFTGVNVKVDEPNMLLAVRPSGDLFYVPTFATTELTNKSVSVGANCDAVNSELRSEALLGSTKASLIELLAQNDQLLKDLILRSAETGAACTIKGSEVAGVTRQVQQLTEKVASLGTKIRTKRTELTVCNSVTPDAPSCKEIEKEIAETGTLLQQSANELIAAQETESNLMIGRDRVCAEQKAASNQAIELTKLVNTVRSEIANIEQSVIGRIDTFGQEFGGTAIAVVSSRAMQQHQELQNANPRYRVRSVPITEASFHLAPPAHGQGATAIPRQTVLAVGVVGGAPHPTMSGETFYDIANATGSVGLTLSLSRIGACSSETTATAGFRIKYNSYTYMNGVAKWNKWTTYKKMESTTKKGGFFSSKTVHDLWESMSAGDNFEFVLLNEDPSINSNEMRKEIQLALLDRIMNEWTDLKSIQSGGSLSMPVAGQHGAAVAADGLSKCLHVYCQIGVGVLKTLDSIFGHDVQESNVERSWNATASDKFTYTQPHESSGIISTAVVIK